MSRPNDDAPFQYTPLSAGGELRFTWHGGEYINVHFAGADAPHAVINTYGAAAAPRLPQDQAAFQAKCDEWIADADPAELARPLHDGPITPEEARGLLEWTSPEAGPEDLLEALVRQRRAQQQHDRDVELLAAEDRARPRHT